jgi:hypothetical protein
MELGCGFLLKYNGLIMAYLCMKLVIFTPSSFESLGIFNNC